MRQDEGPERSIERVFNLVATTMRSARDCQAARLKLKGVAQSWAEARVMTSFRAGVGGNKKLYLCQENYWRLKARRISRELDPTVQKRMISKVRRMLVGNTLTRSLRDEWEMWDHFISEMNVIKGERRKRDAHRAIFARKWLMARQKKRQRRESFEVRWEELRARGPGARPRTLRVRRGGRRKKLLPLETRRRLFLCDPREDTPETLELARSTLRCMLADRLTEHYVHQRLTSHMHRAHSWKVGKFPAEGVRCNRVMRAALRGLKNEFSKKGAHLTRNMSKPGDMSDNVWLNIIEWTWGG